MLEYYHLDVEFQLKTLGLVLKGRSIFGQNLEQTRKKLMFSTWVQNHSPNKSGTDSQTFFAIFRDLS